MEPFGTVGTGVLIVLPTFVFGLPQSLDCKSQSLFEHWRYTLERVPPRMPDDYCPRQVVTDRTGEDTQLAGDAALVAALRAGDERAFHGIVRRYHTALVRLARASVASDAIAEEVAQDTWLAVINGIGCFEGRSSLKTWIFRILINRARSRGAREHRVVPMSSVGAGVAGGAELAVDPDRFVPDGQRWAGHWCDPPAPWSDVPAERMVANETLFAVARAIGQLPTQQREVVTLRDIEGWTAAEVCALLELSEANQRVLLHRGRSRVRSALECHLGGEG
jgi:RNA polymerase sigma-70 factor (ECF subfamily)